MVKKILESFSYLLSGPPELVGSGFKWKQSCLIGAIVGTMYSPIYTYQNSIRYRGELPPTASLIKGVGVFELENEKNGLKNVEIMRLRFIGGSNYIVQDGSSLLPNNIANTGVNFCVEGFLLKNGSGNFWPIFIKDSHGNDVASQVSMRKSLIVNRNPFGSLLMGMWLFTVPLWGVSIFNAIVLMRNRKG